jgi:hypothetical protein
MIATGVARTGVDDDHAGRQRVNGIVDADNAEGQSDAP